MQKKILIVDDEPGNLKLLQQILAEEYSLSFAKSGEAALELAEKNKPDLILLDIMMSGLDGYETCRRLKQGKATSGIPVVFVTAMTDVEDESLGFEVGGVDYITKPVSAPIVRARVKNHLSLVKMGELEKSHRAAIYMLGDAGHYNDNDTGMHIWRMAAYSRAIAEASGWNADLSHLMELSAPMHDTGKIGIPDAILKKPAKLDAEEWRIMKEHSRIGHEILSMSGSSFFDMAGEIALHHNEKWDGSGYPGGLSGDAIPESARIVAIADVFDALSMRRVYKKAWSIEESVAEIKNTAGSHFDPRLVENFVSILPTIREIKDYWDRKESKAEELTFAG